jgi:nicotinamide phosphoribosyltransferase
MKIQPIPDLDDNLILDTDSYKFSHFRHYPPNMTSMFDYFEARGGEFATCTLFGLQYLLHRYLSKPVTFAQVDYAAEFNGKHGLPFNKDGWKHIVLHHSGYLPVRIRAIPEGLVVPVRNALYTVESTDPAVPWIASHIETMLVRLWESSTVATASRESKKVIKRYLDLTADDTAAEIDFKLHDFGGRGVTCKEQARIAGAAHLLSFLGSDTVSGIEMANHYYHDDMAGFSIPATEHSTVCMWGRDREFDMVENFIQKELVQRQVPSGSPKIAACVADTYNVYDLVRRVCDPRGKLQPMIKNSGGTFVIRPDSGDPLLILPQILDIMHQLLGSEVTVNHKGYCVLPAYFRIIQGDGINMKSMEDILACLTTIGWSASNIAFGSGGGLLQKWQRDDQKWKLACSAGTVDGKDIAVSKDPVTDQGKRSKAGRLDLIQCPNTEEFSTAEIPPGEELHPESVMNTVYENGDILFDTTLAECRKRMSL